MIIFHVDMIYQNVLKIFNNFFKYFKIFYSGLSNFINF